MPKFSGIIELHINEITAKNAKHADEIAEAFKDKLAEVEGLRWDEWDFRITWASAPDEDEEATL